MTYIANCKDNIKNGKARIAGPVERILFIIGCFLLLIAAIAVWKIRRLRRVVLPEEKIPA
jgi:hypothetical protein